jgi:hypothetical protein
MKVFHIGSFLITIWWWTKLDKRQKKPTKGFGVIMERK